MKKYTTKPIDFTGCHPVIAEHLKQSEEILCWAWDEDCIEKPSSCHEVWIVRYWQAADYPYRTAGDTFFRHAEPIPVKVKIKRIMPPERAIPVLIAEGWTYCSDGTMCSFGKETIHIGMFSLMGRSVEDPYVRIREWPTCIIEEVEDDE